MELILSFVVGTFVYLVFGYFVFEVLLGKYTKEHTLQLKGFNKSDNESSMLFLIISCAAYSILVTFVIYNWNSELNIVQAFLVSGTIGSLVAIMANSFWYSTTHLYDSLKPLLVDVTAAFVTVGVMGTAISLII